MKRNESSSTVAWLRGAKVSEEGREGDCSMVDVQRKIGEISDETNRQRLKEQIATGVWIGGARLTCCISVEVTEERGKGLVLGLSCRLLIEGR